LAAGSAAPKVTNLPINDFFSKKKNNVYVEMYYCTVLLLGINTHNPRYPRDIPAIKGYPRDIPGITRKY
jgi:hypothetical protein